MMTMVGASIDNKFERMPDMPLLKKAHREWVYFVEADSDPVRIKIGHSHRLKQRLCSLQRHSPVQLKLIAVVHAPAGAEFAFHRIFDGCRSHGEWFYPSAELLETVKSLPAGGAFEGADLHRLGAKYGISVPEINKSLWQGTRRTGRRGYKVKDQMPKRKRVLERLIVDGYVPETMIRPSARNDVLACSALRD